MTSGVSPVLYIIDDDPDMVEAVVWLARSRDIETETYLTATEFLDSYEPGACGCVLADMKLPDMTGLEMHSKLQQMDPHIPVIIITGYPSIQLAVDSMKGGAADFIQKPVDNDELMSAIGGAFELSATRNEARDNAARLKAPLDLLTARERDVFDQLVQGHTSKMIGDILGITQKTVETHRANIMRKTRAGGLADLIALTKVGASVTA